MSSQTAEAYEEYKRIRKDTKSLVKQAKDKHWEIFSKKWKVTSIDCRNKFRD